MNVTTVRVTDKHIADGVRKSCGKCPIALALLDALAGEFDVWQRLGVNVGDLQTDIVFLDATGSRHQYAAMPVVAEDFVHAFDEGKHVAPVEFDLTWQEGRRAAPGAEGGQG